MSRKKIILAVSGGIDSMVMLDWFCSSDQYIKDDIIVAHFDHGIRDNSDDDATFVSKKCKEYGVKFIKGLGELDKTASEDEARKSRYAFLYKLSNKYSAEIYTAHHLNDLAESVAINLLRGTGWRGLAVLSAEKVQRPFLDLDYAPSEFARLVPMTKKAIYAYAAAHNITFREDQTNSSDEYLRNRIRHQINEDSFLDELYTLWKKQRKVRAEINMLLTEITSGVGIEWQRAWFKELDGLSAIELLRFGLELRDIKITRPQLYDFLNAIKTYAPGKYFNLPNDRLVKIQKNVFILDDSITQ